MKLGCLVGVEYKNKIIFISSYINGIFELDMNTRKIQFIRVIEGEKCESCLFRKAFLSGNEAWFIPEKANHVICVNLKTYEIKYFKLQYNKKYMETTLYPKYCAFFDGIMVDERYLYCIPNGIDSLLAIDLKVHRDMAISVLNNPENDTIYSAYFYLGKVHLLSQKGLLDKTICIGKNNVGKREWKFNSNGYLSSVQSGTDLYLIPAYLEGGKSRKLAKINLITEDVDYIDMPDVPEEYYGGMLINECLLLLPNSGINFIKLDLKEKVFKKVPYPSKLENKLRNCNNGARIIASKKRRLVSLSLTGYILEFDEKGNISNYFHVDNVENTDIKKITAEYKKKRITLPPIVTNEEDFLSLKEYMLIV